MRLLVTGASSGIGRAVAEAMAGDAELYLFARRADLLSEVAEATGGVPVVGDVGNIEDCRRLVAAAVGESELCLVNAAGSAAFGSFHELASDALHDQIRSNLVGTINACHAAIPEMLRVGKGQIVNVLSIAARHVFPGAAAYAAAKAGALMFTQVLNAEYRRLGVRCTAVLPGSVDTPIWEGQGFVPERGDMLQPEAVAEAIRDLLLMPRDRSVDEVVLMPPKGVL